MSNKKKNKNTSEPSKDIHEGKVSKGGVNGRPTTPPPEPPKGQGGYGYFKTERRGTYVPPSNMLPPPPPESVPKSQLGEQNYMEAERAEAIIAFLNGDTTAESIKEILGFNVEEEIKIEEEKRRKERAEMVDSLGLANTINDEKPVVVLKPNTKELLKEHEDEIRKQVDSQVVLYNIKDKKAFFMISPEEARFVLDLIRKRRAETTHVTHITPMFDQKWFNKHDKQPQKGTMIMSQHISNIQISAHVGYEDDVGALLKQYSSTVNLRGAVAQPEEETKIFDVATNPRTGNTEDDIKIGFLRLLEEKIKNDLVAYHDLIDQMRKDGLSPSCTDPEPNIELWEVAAQLLYKNIKYSGGMPTHDNASGVSKYRNGEHIRDAVHRLVIDVIEMPTERVVYHSFKIFGDMADTKPNIVGFEVHTVLPNARMEVSKPYNKTAHVFSRMGRVFDRITEGERVFLGYRGLELSRESIAYMEKQVEEYIMGNEQPFILHLLVDREKDEFGIVLIEF